MAFEFMLRSLYPFFARIALCNDCHSVWVVLDGAQVQRDQQALVPQI